MSDVTATVAIGHYQIMACQMPLSVHVIYVNIRCHYQRSSHVRCHRQVMLRQKPFTRSCRVKVIISAGHVRCHRQLKLVSDVLISSCQVRCHCQLKIMSDVIVSYRSCQISLSGHDMSDVIIRSCHVRCHRQDMICQK
jgi:hypothetical protein